MRHVSWVALLLLAFAMPGGSAGAASPALSIAAVREWTPPPGADGPAQAQAALDATPARPGQPEFRVPARQPVWYALDLPPAPGGQPALLELTQPSVRSAQVYLPGAGTPVAWAGRDVPASRRQGTRFPASLELPPEALGQRVYLRLAGTIPMRGEFLLQPLAQGKDIARNFVVAIGLCLSVALLSSAYAFARALRVRSAAWGLYGLLGLTTTSAAMFIIGFGESWLWPLLANLRGEASALLACLASGFALMLAERVFALDVRVPRFAKMLRAAGWASVVAGVAGLAFSLPVHQVTSHVTALAAMVLGLCSLWLAWRTHNRPAAWLLVGFTPVVVGVGATTLGISGIVPFSPWILLAMPVGAVLELPFNLYGLHLLERQHLMVRQSLAEVAQDEAVGETRREMVQRLSRVPRATGAGSLLMLLRLEALAPGSPTLLSLDAVAVERFVHMLMAAAVRPGIQAGRWSHHELALRGPLRLEQSDVDALATTLFSRALRIVALGIEPRKARLRIAWGRVPGARPLDAALGDLAAALDDPGHAGRLRVEWDFARGRIGGPAEAVPV
ncbi:MAG: 7TM diverse intracellular signaling domain-containing protein [Ramlibacter sp.]|nr:7TM diverse intracellular signaling domain-containing protein [Ramlibacter sp.]